MKNSITVLILIVVAAVLSDNVSTYDDTTDDLSYYPDYDVTTDENSTHDPDYDETTSDPDYDVTTDDTDYKTTTDDTDYKTTTDDTDYKTTTDNTDYDTTTDDTDYKTTTDDTDYKTTTDDTDYKTTTDNTDYDTTTDDTDEACRLPNCRHSGVDIPGNLENRNTPQFVVLTFDDSVNSLNILTYRRLLYNRFNTNGCPTGVTFYVNHEYTDYVGVNELYSRGFEIALHSITHRTPQTFWRNASYDDLVHEFANQRQQLAQLANIPANSIKGLRMPFLQMAGNNQFRMMADHGFLYDASWPTSQFTDPALWPYTLHHPSTQECTVAPPCPTESIPGPWVLPIISWRDLEGFPCTFADACVFPPDLEDENAWYNFIITNFERHYKGNRTPFGIYLHEGFLRVNPAIERAFTRFLNLINNMYDTFMVTSEEVIEWVKNPVPVNEYSRQNCRFFQGTHCRQNTCPLLGRHTTETFYLRICGTCPRVYPWVDNPLGL